MAPPTGRLQLHFLDVGQGDAALIVSPQGQVVLVDNGVLNNCNAPVSYLQARGVTGVEAQVASHYHADHIGCTEQVFATAPLQLAGIDRGGSYTTQTYQRYVAAVGSKRLTALPGRTVTLDSGVQLDFLAANGAGVPGANDENDLSVVMRVRFGAFDAVFGGDLSGAAAGGYSDVETTVGPLVGPVEVYKVHHHGSRYSSNASWLQAIRPRVGIVSVGASNTYGHPAAEAMARLHAANVRTYWTSAGNGVSPVAGLDTVAGNVIVEVAPNASTFSVRYGNNTDTFSMLGAALAPPEPPTNLASTVSGSTVNLSWLPPAGGDTPTSYVIEAALTAGGPTVGSLPTGATGISIPGVPNGTYFVRVRSQNADGVSPASNEIAITVGQSACASPPAPPGTLTGSVAAGTVSLAWGASVGGCGATGYTVRAGVAPGQTTQVSLPVGTATSFQAAAPPGTYYVAVSAENAFGSSTLSNEVQLVVTPSCTLPGAPLGFSASSSGTNALLSWSPPSTGGAATGYVLEAGTASGLANLGALPMSALSLSTPVPPGTYFLRVKAQNACGVGPASAEQVLTMACVVPGTPGAPGASVSGSTANVSWSGVSGATSYRLDVGTVAGSSNVFSQNVTGNSRVLSGLGNGTYFMRVTALNACGASQVSGEGMFAVSVVASPTCGGASVPASVSCGTPTAQCNNGQWSCSQNRSGTCSSNGGVRCWVCPGRLC